MANKNIIPRSKTTDTSDEASFASFLPRHYRSDANKKFLHSTITQLTQPGYVKKVSGYIGRSHVDIHDDVFIDAPTQTRQNYQLEPGFIINDDLDNTVFLKDYQDYINQLRVFGANVSNHSRLNKQEFYSWNPHINWDMFVNFQNYYWMPHGPNVITIQNFVSNVTTSTYYVTVDNNSSYVFSPDGITKNPAITLFRGQTYKFIVDSIGNSFNIKTLRTAGLTNRYITPGLVNNGIQSGTITFRVPENAPDMLVYVSESNIDIGGVFNILDLSDSSYINVDAEIIGKKTYTFNNVSLSNGMKVQFAGNVFPKKYATGRYYVEGVGSKIQLINEIDLQIITPYTSNKSMLFDTTEFDITPFSDSTSYITSPDYIVINRASFDKNPWSRNNKWIHKDVIETTGLVNGVPATYDQTLRAVRPIIEFEKNLKLFNFGVNAIEDIDLIDTFTLDAFSTVEGSLGYNIDGITVASGQRVIFVNDTDSRVKNKVFKVEYVNVLHDISSRRISKSGTVEQVTSVNSGWTAVITGLDSVSGLVVGANLFATNGTGKLYSGTKDPDIIKVTKILSSTSVQYTVIGGSKPKLGTISNILTTIDSSRQIRLVEIDEPKVNQVVLVKQGVVSQGKMYRYTGSEWKLCQQKTDSNQPPLFDLTDSTGVSFGDTEYYPGTTFNGTSIFSYKVGNGTTDSSLGFPLSYKNINNIGDIVFNFSLITDTFKYKLAEKTIIIKTDIGFLVKFDESGDFSYENGWEISAIKNSQPAIRLYKESNIVNNFAIDIFDKLPTLDKIEVRVYLNNERVLHLGDQLNVSSTVNEWTLTNINGREYQVTFKNDVQLTDTIMIKVFSMLPINTNGFFELPINLQNNPLNGTLSEFTLGEVKDHVKSIIDNVFNNGYIEKDGVGNLRDLGSLSYYGTKFIQHSGPASLSYYHITSNTNNIIRAIDQSRDDYCKFKKGFLTTASTLGIDAEPIYHVDAILKEMFKDNSKTSPYYFSDMAPYGARTQVDFISQSPDDNMFSLSEVFSLTTLSTKSVNVYLNGNQLLHKTQYEFTDQGFVLILEPLIRNDIVTVYEYDTTDGCFIPETPTKLGMWPKYEPKKFLDTSLINPQYMIQGHDGSLTLAYHDYRDELILELEKRIYNNIKVSYNPDIFDLTTIIPSYLKTTDYSLDEFNAILMPNFNKWASDAGIGFSTLLSYDKTNSFTFNYANHTTPDGQVTPAYWRGIYQWMLGTDRPHICPWEMLGFTEEPVWWNEVYGPAPYTCDNLVLWNDISNGIVREPNKSVIRINQYVRPFLKEHIPVDNQGNLISPLYSGLAIGQNVYSSQGDFKFGDISPVEAAWRRNSHCPFSILKTAVLMYPASVIGMLFDRSRIVKNNANQIVYSETNVRITPSSIKIPSIYLSDIRIQTAGLVNYVINYLNCETMKLYNIYKSDLQSITAKLCYRVSGFTSKEKFNLLLDSKSPVSTGNIFIPSEDYKVVLNTSSPITIVTYSGVIITKVVGGFEIKGYSQLTPYFKYYTSSTNTGSMVNVGGISKGYFIWEYGVKYDKGSIVMYQSNFYQILEDHIATSVTTEFYLLINSLPIVGGTDVIFKTQWNTTSKVMPYGTKITSIQGVVDFLLGYGKWLSDQGFTFNEFSFKLEAVSNWETSAKEFVFWTMQNWTAPTVSWIEWSPGINVKYGDIVRYNGDFYKALITSTIISFDENDFYLLNGVDLTGNSVISLSPAANKLVFDPGLSVVDNINNPNNVYEMFDASGRAINAHFVNTYRNDTAVSYSPRNTNIGIYCASFYLIQFEHVVVINNNTIFNDTIYNLESGYKQDKIKVSGYVSSSWNGSLNVPGFIVDRAVVTEWTPWQTYAIGDLVKYKSFYYSANMLVPGAESFNNTQWIKLDKKPVSKMIPNWNYKAGQFTDFYNLDSENFDLNQQKIAQHLTGYQKRQYLENIIQDDVSEYKFYQGMIIEKGTQNVLNKLFDVLSADNKESLNFYEEWALRVGQYGACSAFENIEFTLSESLFKVNPQGFQLVNEHTLDSDVIIQQTASDIYLKPNRYNPNVWPIAKPSKTSAVYARIDEVTLTLKTLDDLFTVDMATVPYGSYILCTFAPVEWNVYQYVNRKNIVTITNITNDSDSVTFTLDNIIDIQIGSLVTINDSLVTTVFEVYNVSGTNITVLSTASFDIETTSIEGIFVSRRIKKTISDNNYKLDDISENTLLWTDNDLVENDFYNDTSNWKVWKYKSIYTRNSRVPNNDNIFKYGRSISTTKAGTTVVVSSVINESINNGNTITTVPSGLIMVYNKTVLQGWVLTQVIYNPTHYAYNVSYRWDEFGSVVAVSSDGTWIAVGSPTADLYQRGSVHVFKKDSNGVYSLHTTLVSPTPQNAEQFGRLLVFGNDVLYVGTTIGKVYKIVYKLVEHASSVYISAGSTGTSIHLVDVDNIEIDMIVSGKGFNGQTVSNINATSNTITVSSLPSDEPAELIVFSKYEWFINNTIESTSPQYGASIAISNNNTLLISEPYNEDNSNIVAGKVYIYDSNLEEIGVINATSSSKLFGKYIAISENDDYIAVSSLVDNTVYEGKVEIYKFNEYTNPVQVLSSPALTVSGEFGSNLTFINNYKTLVIGHAITPMTFDFTFNDGTTFTTFYDATYSSAIDIFDRYDDQRWMFSERLVPQSIVDDLTFGASLVVTPTSVVVSTPNSNVIYEYIKPFLNAFTWSVKNNAIAKPDVTKVKQAFLYNKRTNKLIKYLDVIDPIQQKYISAVDQEIKYKFSYDPAVYTKGTALVNVDEGVAWGSQHIGSLWWDLRTVKFVDNFTDNILYRNTMLSNLAYGASVDIYEWVGSKYLPSKWDSLADTDLGLAANISGKSLYGDSVYTEVKQYDTLSQTFTSTYFFWVKNREITFVGRSLSASRISKLISNPKGEGYQYLALTGLDSFSLVNVKPLLLHNDVVLSVEYWTIDNIDQNIHTEWKLISTASTTRLPAAIEDKWINSLCGKDLSNKLIPDQTLPVKLQYGIENRPRQSMFVNRFEALKQVIEQTNLSLKQTLITDTRSLENLKKYDTPPSILNRLYDIAFDTDSEIRFAITKNYKIPEISPVIKDGKIISVVVNNAGQGYLVEPVVTVYGDGVGAVLKTNINELGQITSVTVENSGYGYNDSTKLVIRNFAVLVTSDSTSNNKWSIYSYLPSSNSWFKSLSYSYDVTKYWDYVDWYAPGLNQFTTIQYSVDTYADLYLINPQIGDIVKVRTTNSNRWVLLERHDTDSSNTLDLVYDWTQLYKIVGSKNGTIQFKSLLYDFKDTAIGFDGSIYDALVYDNYADIELRIILTAIKDDLLIDDLKSEYLKLFFTSIRYALTEQTYVDWIFKTSFVNAMHNVGNLHTSINYKNDNLSNFEDYISEVKPYRTQIREYTSAYNVLDNTNTGVSDFDLPTAYDSVSKSFSVVDENNPMINVYPWKNWVDNVGYSITEIKITNNGSNYISEPTVTIESDTGTGAIAKAFIVNNQVSRIKIISVGNGYTTTPTVKLIGGYSNIGTPATAVAILGKSVIRTNTTKLKFDRIYQNFVIDDLQYTEQLSNVTGTKVQFQLKWLPDLTIGKTTVTINGLVELRDMYTVGVVPSVVNNHLEYTGIVTFKTAPAKNSDIIITYYKNIEILTATDRIHYFYEPLTGEIGKDIPQLVSGVDYGGVIVDGFNFNVVHGWDSVPFYTDTWDNFNPELNDIKIVVDTSFSYNVKLPYIPEKNTIYNVYYTKFESVIINGTSEGAFNVSDTSVLKSNMKITFMNTDGGVETETVYYIKQIFENVSFTISNSPDSAAVNVYGSNRNVGYVYHDMVRLDDLNYKVGEVNQDNINAIMESPVATGDSDIIQLPTSINALPGDIFVIRKTTSDGSFVSDYDTLVSGGNFTAGSASDVYNDDAVIDGDTFYSLFNGYGPEEVVPGQVVDSVALKVYTKSETGSFMQFKDRSNKVTFNRLNNNTQTKLTKDLHQDDTSIFVENSSRFYHANLSTNTPGVVYINGERIEYFTNLNNVLGNLRRGTVGTGVPTVHKAQSVVNDISFSELSSYTDTTRIDQFVSDGSNIITLSYKPEKSLDRWSYASNFVSSIPPTYGQSDEIEVFVGGYRSNAIWSPGVAYEVNDIVNVGVYVYKCILSHTSSSNFKSDRAKWVYFIGNVRLKKSPYIVHNPNSLEGDVQFDADFSVNGTLKQIRLTYPVSPGTLITVIKKTGMYWLVGDAPTHAFINSVPAAEYNPPVI